MKKSVILFIVLSFFTLSVALASTTYYVTRSGEIMHGMFHIPIHKNAKMNLICNTIFVKVGMDRYFMVRDDGSEFTRRSLVGCQEYASTNIFDSLLMLNSDSIPEKITSDELKRANIRFVKFRGAVGMLDYKNKNNDLPLDQIAYIDLSTLTYYTDAFGEAHMYLKPKNEDQFLNKNRYMKEILVEIRSIPITYANRMFNIR